MMQSSNAGILREVQQAKWPRKFKACTMFTAEQRASLKKKTWRMVLLDLQDLSENDPSLSDSDLNKILLYIPVWNYAPITIPFYEKYYTDKNAYNYKH